MREVEFIKDFANKSKGDKESYDGMLASHLVNKDKVAKYVTKAKPKAKNK
mgnify:CR=1 FL=1|tara:strand:+ start:1457 stop:1606 length:150 start_codon:yes stop_codon:yes gene_type:complete